MISFNDEKPPVFRAREREFSFKISEILLHRSSCKYSLSSSSLIAFAPRVFSSLRY